MGMVGDAIKDALGLGGDQFVGVEGPALTIREVSGRKRSVSLKGRFLPFQQPEWSGSQRVVTTYYAGNPVATQQIMGPTEDPTTFSGYWSDKYLVAGGVTVAVKGFADPTSVMDLYKIVDDLRLSGQQLKVTWSELRRTGVVKRFAIRPDRVEDIAWSLEFEWASNKTDAPAAFGPPFDLNKIKSAANDLSDLMALDPVDTLQAFEAAVFELINDIQAQVDSFLSQAAILADAVNIPGRVVQAMRSAAMSITFSIGALMKQMAESPYTIAQTTDVLASVYLMEAFRRDAAFLGSTLRDSVLGAARNIEARQAPNPLKIVTADESGSLRTIAQQEYGDADAWTTIADANGFESSRVPPGTQVYIPPAPTATGVN